MEAAWLLSSGYSQWLQMGIEPGCQDTNPGLSMDYVRCVAYVTTLNLSTHL